jgi:hypothetical protein
MTKELRVFLPRKPKEQSRHYTFRALDGRFVQGPYTTGWLLVSRQASRLEGGQGGDSHESTTVDRGPWRGGSRGAEHVHRGCYHWFCGTDSREGTAEHEIIFREA